MKTLDEIIKAISICKNADINRTCKDCPMPDTHECMGILMTDALWYIRNYRDLLQDLVRMCQDSEFIKEHYLKDLRK